MGAFGVAVNFGLGGTVFDYQGNADLRDVLALGGSMIDDHCGDEAAVRVLQLNDRFVRRAPVVKSAEGG